MEPVSVAFLGDLCMEKYLNCVSPVYLFEPLHAGLLDVASGLISKTGRRRSLTNSRTVFLSSVLVRSQELCSRITGKHMKHMKACAHLQNAE